MFIVNHRKIFFVIAGLLVALSIASGMVFGLHFGLDFTGGSLIEVTYPNGRPSLDMARSNLSATEKLSLGEFTMREAGEKSFVLRTRTLTPDEKTSVLQILSQGDLSTINEERFNSVGPTVAGSLERLWFDAPLVLRGAEKTSPLCETPPCLKTVASTVCIQGDWHARDDRTIPKRSERATVFSDTLSGAGDRPSRTRLCATG